MARTSGTRHGNGGKGAGWGGPAKGAGSGPAAAFTAESETRRLSGLQDPAKRMTRAERRAQREERVGVLEDTLFAIATNEEQPGNVRVTAAKGLHAIYEGQPVARVISHSTDDVGQLSDDALRDELARLGREAAGAFEGDEASRVQGELGGVLH